MGRARIGFKGEFLGKDDWSMGIKTIRERESERGNTLVLVIWMGILLGGISSALVVRSVGSSKSTNRSVLETRLLFVAESGISANFAMMDADAVYGVKDLAFKLDTTAKDYVGPVTELKMVGTEVNHSYQLRVQYSNAGTPVVFADRTDPVEDYDGIKVTCIAEAGEVRRVVAGWYEQALGEEFQGAIVSDMVPLEPATAKPGKGVSRKGHVTFKGPTQYLFGDIISNGDVIADIGALSTENAGDFFTASGGAIRDGLAGSEEEETLTLLIELHPRSDKQLKTAQNYVISSPRRRKS